MAEGFQSSEDEEILKSVLGLSRKKDMGECRGAFDNFVSQLVRFATGDDRIWEDPKALLERALDAWADTARRKSGEHALTLKLVEGADWRESRLVLNVATDDRPFLVDSVTAALAEAGKPVSFFANAVVPVTRDAQGRRKSSDGSTRESIMRAEMDPPVDAAEMERLEAELRRVLADVAVAVGDWADMHDRLGHCISQLERVPDHVVPPDERREAVDFLTWLWNHRFSFLGVRRYRIAAADGRMLFEHDPEGDLGILRDRTRRVLKSTFSADGHLSPAVEEFMRSPEPILVAKANAKSIVHRRVYMDYIGVKTYALDGRVTGEERFVGLFTAENYNRPASDIPLLRAKVGQIVQQAGFPLGGHNEKALLHILETFPRDEMFQTDVAYLRETALGILRLYKRPRVKLFLRRDRFDRFISAIVFVPRERFGTAVRESIGRLLAGVFKGRVSAFYPLFGEGPLARVHYIIGIDPGAPPGPGVTELTRQIRALVRDWSDDLLEALRAEYDGDAARLFDRYGGAFDAAYREDMKVPEALTDIGVLESIGERSFALRVFRDSVDGPSSVGIKIYKKGAPMRLSTLIPTLENLGLSAVNEQAYEVRPKDTELFWLQDFVSEERFGRPIDVGAVKRLLEEALTAALEGRTEDDGFNALVVAAGLDWREAWMLRACAKYLLQTGFSFSQRYIEDALARHAQIARQLIRVFHARFNPAGSRNLDARAAEVADAEAAVLASLESVESLDEDRIIRRFLNLFGAMLRTNYFQRTKDGLKPYISFKVDSSKVDGLPDPRPYCEIFVSSPRVDGVHLRFGPVARGGLRWSDRREDYRTEVLGLVKAQRVKNAVIVPTGAKGGFYPKQLPTTGDRAAVFEEGREAYKVFIRGLLDVTDNIVGGQPATPGELVAWDGTDAYLVVAADKGTATFSDTANAISAEYGFWLGDAFASGGSAGYDHKAMGITARGAWEAVKRHFREIGKDIQCEPFTVVGVGDMSGDVFGNGMLLSEQVRLVAAFDHRDIFVDPCPDPAVSFKERARLFGLPRSSWQDYDKARLSKGGGIFSRAAKSIPLSPEMKALFGLAADKVTPAELIRAILKAPVELIWLGGIGTYFKASFESHAAVGDKANDALRLDATEIRAKVIGEGANLGLTQAARIEYARAGGRLNTDAIDNSAGVDTSDHEVNIKILLSTAIERGDLKEKERNPLLSAMTDDVAAHVLRHNYAQTRAISLMESNAALDLPAQARTIAAFEREGRLDRAVEGLPDNEKIAGLLARGQGLTRPEIAVLLAYGKMHLFEALVASGAPDDPAFVDELYGYFPEALHRLDKAMMRHPLRREIVARRLANEIMDTCGATFALRAAEATGATCSQVALSYEAVRRTLRLADFAAGVDSLDNIVPASLQIMLYHAGSDLLRELTLRILANSGLAAQLEQEGVGSVVDRYAEGVEEFRQRAFEILPGEAAASLEARADALREQGAPDSLARDAALMPALERAFDVIELARATTWPLAAAGAVFFELGRRLGLDEAAMRAKAAPNAEHFDRLAILGLVEDVKQRQAALAARLIAFAGAAPTGPTAEWLPGLFATWSERNAAALDGYDRFLGEVDLASGVNVGKLALIDRKLADIALRLGA